MSKNTQSDTPVITDQQVEEITPEDVEILASPEADKIDTQKVAWRVRNADKVKGYQQTWRKKNPDKVKTSHSNYQKNNPEKVQLWHERSRLNRDIDTLTGRMVNADENTRAALVEKIAAKTTRIAEIADELEALKADG
jgi:uncharacterized protein with WD repeat